MPEWQTLHTEYCRIPLWQVLHYYRPEHLYIRSEFYPVPVVEPEIPLVLLGLPVPGVQYQTEEGYRHITVYEPQLYPKPQLQVVMEYDEAYTKHALGLGSSDVNVGGGFEVAPEYFGLWASGDFAYAEAELQIGTDVILGTLYFEQPGWLVFGQSGGGVNVSTPVDRYLVAFEEDVEKAGGYEKYGEDRLGSGYEFGEVLMQAYNKWILYANWSGQYRDPNIPNDPEWLMRRLEEFP